MTGIPNYAVLADVGTSIGNMNNLDLTKRSCESSGELFNLSGRLRNVPT